jgi:hypothetical protein
MSDTNEPDSCLPPSDVELIRPLLEEFRSAKRSKWKHTIRKAVTTVMASRDVGQLRPLAQGNMIAQVKEVAIEMTQ